MARIKKRNSESRFIFIIELETKVLPALVDMKFLGVRIDEDHKVEVLAKQIEEKTIDSTYKE